MLPDTLDPTQRFLNFMLHKKLVQQHECRSWTFETYCKSQDGFIKGEVYLTHPTETGRFTFHRNCIPGVRDV